MKNKLTKLQATIKVVDLMVKYRITPLDIEKELSKVLQLHMYSRQYSNKIEKLIEKEIAISKEEDNHDGRFNQRFTKKQYREYAIDNLIGNGIIKLNL